MRIATYRAAPTSASRVRKAIFPVAGLGTRFLPATKALPKETLTLVDRPLIQYAVDEARAAGIEQFIFVTARGKTNIEDHFDAAPELERSLERAGKLALLQAVRDATLECGQVSTVRQHRPLGLGHAVWCARHLIGDEPFAVILPDDVVSADTPCLRQMVEVQAETGGSVIAAMEVAPEQAQAYGILDVMSGEAKNRNRALEPCRDRPLHPATHDLRASVGAVARLGRGNPVDGRHRRRDRGGRSCLCPSLQRNAV